MADEFYGKGIKIASGFDLSAKSPLDNRTVVNTIAERDAHIIGNRVYEGMRVYVKETKRDYLFDGSTWIEDVANSGGGVTEVFMGDTEPEEETILLWVDTSEDENVANEGLSEEIEKSISDLSKRVKALEENDLLVFQDELHSHANKSVLDGITTNDIWNWNHPNISGGGSVGGFSGDYNDLKNKPTIPTKVSELINDEGYLTEHQDVSWDAIIGKPTTFEPTSHSHSINDISDYPNDLATKDYVDEAINNAKLEGGDAQVDLSTYAKKTDLHDHENKEILDTISANKINEWDNKSDFDGNYNSLTNKPTIPTKTSQLTNDSGFITSIPNEYITDSELNSKGYLTEHQDISGKVDKVNGYSLVSDAEISRLATLENYDDTEVRELIDETNASLDNITNDTLDGKSFKYLTEIEYNNLSESDKSNESIVYCITDKSEPTFSLALNGNELSLMKDNVIISSVTIPTSSGGTSTPTVIYGNLVISTTSLSVNEGATTTFTVKLDKAPTNNQVVNISKNNSDVTLSVTSLTFTPTNYSTAQTVTITVAQDDTDYSNETCVITCSSDNVSSKSITVNITDNDTEPSGADYVNIAYNTDTFANPSTDNHPAGTNYYSVSGQSNKSVSNGILTITRKDDTTGDSSILIKHGNDTNNKVYLRVMVRTTTSGVNAFCGGTLGNIVNDGEWHLVSCIANDTNYLSNFLAINCGNTTNGSGFDIKEFMKIDLTAIYGTGKEPSKNVCDATFTTYVSGLVG